MKPATASTTPYKIEAGVVHEAEDFSYYKNRGEYVINIKTKPSSATLIYSISKLAKP